MKFLLRVAIAAASIASIPPAIAGEGGPGLTSIVTAPPAAVAQAPVRSVPPVR